MRSVSINRCLEPLPRCRFPYKPADTKLELSGVVLSELYDPVEQTDHRVDDLWIVAIGVQWVIPPSDYP